MALNLGYDPKILKYQGIIFSLVSKYANTKDQNEIDDLIMAGIEGMYEAIRTYKKEGKSSLSTWIYIHSRDAIQREKNSTLLVKVSCPTAHKLKISLLKGNAGRELLRQEESKQYNNDTPLSLLMDKEDEEEKIRAYNKAWLKLNRKFTSQERLVIIDHYVHNKSLKYLDKKYKVKSLNIINKVRIILGADNALKI